MLSAIKNAEYGFDRSRAHSPGGLDGIFLLTRDFRPKNEMMKKIFDKFLDRKNSGAKEIADALDCSLDELIAVRLVSHHLRLLGVIRPEEGKDTLVLVDHDRT